MGGSFSRQPGFLQFDCSSPNHAAQTTVVGPTFPEDEWGAFEGDQGF